MWRWMLSLTLFLSSLFLLLIAIRFGVHTVLPSDVVAYVALRDGNPVMIIHDLTHHLKQQVHGTNFISPSFSPDGNYLVFAELFRYGSDIIVSDLSGTTVRNLTQSQFRDETPVWSPDGEWIAFSSNRQGKSNIYLIRPDGTDLHRVTGADAGELEPSWSPDGQYLAYRSNQAGNWDIYTVHLASGTITQLTTHRAPDTMPSWSPDGQGIAFVSRRDGSASIYTYIMKTGQIEPLIVTSHNDDEPSWRPDGRGLTFSRVLNSLTTTMMVNLVSGDITRLDLGDPFTDELVWLNHTTPFELSSK